MDRVGMGESSRFWPENASSNMWWRFTIRCALAAFALVLAQWLILPGFIGIDVPSHSDLWRYYAVAHNQPLRVALVSPRPLMLLFLHVLGPIESPRILFCLLNVPALIFVAAGSIVGERLAYRSAGHVVVFLAFVILFSTPTFYELNPLDYGGMLAGVFVAALAMWFIVERDRTKVVHARPFIVTMLVAGILTYLSIDTKPTFAAVLPVLPFILIGRYSVKRVLLLCLVCASFIALSVIKDILLKSPFIDTSSDTSPYRIATSPVAVIKAAGFYVGRVLPVVLLPLAVLLSIRAWRENRVILLSAFVATVLTVLPMCAIPTRLLAMYSWFGLMAFASLLTPYAAWRGMGMRTRVGVVIFTAAGLCALAFGWKQPDSVRTHWVVANQEFNRNALAGLEILQSKVIPGERLLVTGPMLPFNPFANDDFIATSSAKNFSWAVAYPASETALIAISHDSRVHIPFSDVDIHQFDRVAIFDADGHLASLTAAADFAGLDTGEVASRFYCSVELAQTNLDARAVKVVACLNGVAEYRAALSYAASHGEDSANQWMWYHRGKAYEALHRTQEAEGCYRHAATIENAPIFEEAIERVKTMQR